MSQVKSPVWWLGIKMWLDPYFCLLVTEGFCLVYHSPEFEACKMWLLKIWYLLFNLLNNCLVITLPFNGRLEDRYAPCADTAKSMFHWLHPYKCQVFDGWIMWHSTCSPSLNGFPMKKEHGHRPPTLRLAAKSRCRPSGSRTVLSKRITGGSSKWPAGPSRVNSCLGRFTKKNGDSKLKHGETWAVSPFM